MSLLFSLLPFLITLVNSVWSNQIGVPLFGSMGGFPNSNFPYVDAVFVLSCVPPSHLIHFPYWSCQIDPTPSSIDPTPSPSPIDPTQSLIDPTSVILVYFHRLHCSSDPIPTNSPDLFLIHSKSSWCLSEQLVLCQTCPIDRRQRCTVPRIFIDHGKVIGG